jgi:Fur family transcriptional regulator, ferric uptake regulator
MLPRIEEILRRNQLSVTDTRKKILELFLKSNGAIEHADIGRKAGEKFDRVTVYRTLQSFVEKGIVHTIPTSDNTIKYALCKDECGHGHHHDNHVHFICDTCGETTCLEHVTVPEVMLPRGFKMTRSEMVVSGICGNCH